MTHGDYRSIFLQLVKDVENLPMFNRMKTTVENSPWHREANVFVHTQMVVAEYIARTDAAVGQVWSWNDFMGGVAALFHDVGKPPAEYQKWSEARGHYRGYGGHELLSARMFETWAIEQGTMFDAIHIAAISFIIEYHLPWAAADAQKRHNLALTVNHYCGADVFVRHLLADQYGRISDNKAADNLRADTWAEEFLKLAEDVKTSPSTNIILPDDAPVMYIPIGPSGCGKSTYLAKLREQIPNINVFSLDALRHEWYDAVNYHNAYEASVADKSFEAKANARFHAMVKERRPMYIDNTNLSARRRKMYLEGARKNGYGTVAALMPISLNTLMERRTSRTDKTVPESAVRQHYNVLQAPLIGEFQRIVVLSHNMNLTR